VAVAAARAARATASIDAPVSWALSSLTGIAAGRLSA
jgi:hypothetical protein